MNHQPLVSVLMTAYNREVYISEAIQSVIMSTYSNWELIICDDCSTDNTLQIANKFAELDRRISVYQNHKNLGDYPNRNKAASYAKGDYLMYVDSDDKILYDGIESCVNLMLNNPKSNFGIRYFIDNKNSFVMESNNVIRTHFLKHPMLLVGPGGMIINRDFFNSIAGYPEKYGPANDMYFSVKAALNTPVVFITSEFSYYRIHDGQEKNNQYSYLYNNYLYLNDLLNDLNLPLTNKEIDFLRKKNKRRFLVNIINYYLSTFNLKNTLRAIKNAEYSFSDAFVAVFH